MKDEGIWEQLHFWETVFSSKLTPASMLCQNKMSVPTSSSAMSAS
jgi:hypothetical protein